MSLYIHALSDAPVMPWIEDDGRRVESVAIEDIFAIAERRAAAPVVSEAELQRQHAIVLRIAEAAPAVLPARFGSLLDEAELSAILRQRQALIKTALDHVRHNVQMTLRLATAPPGVERVPPASGREYMQRRREELAPPPPADIEPTLRALEALILDERRKGGDRGAFTMYHLIRRADVREYREVVTASAPAGMAMSGPWPPFAFAPDLFA